MSDKQLATEQEKTNDSTTAPPESQWLFGGVFNSFEQGFDATPTGPTWLSQVTTDGHPANRDDGVIDAPKVGLQTDFSNAADGSKDAMQLNTDLNSVSGGATLGSDRRSIDGKHAEKEYKQLNASVDRDKASLSFGGGDWQGDAEEKKGRGRAVAFNVDSNGKGTGSYTIRNGKNETTLGGGLDLDAEGNLESVEAGASYKGAGGTKVGVNAKMLGQSPRVEGNTVSWDAGGSMGASLGRGARSAGVSGSAELRQTRTFATPEKARAFAKELESERKDNRKMNFAEMEKGEAASFFQAGGVNGDAASGIAGVSGEDSTSKRFTVVREGDELAVQIQEIDLTKLGGNLASGPLGVGLDGSNAAQRDLQLRVRLDSPDALAALQTAIDGGELGPEALQIEGLDVGEETVDKACAGGNMDLFIAKLSEEVCTGTGTYIDADTQEQGTLRQASSKEDQKSYFPWLHEAMGWNNPDTDGSYSDETKLYEPELFTPRGETDDHLRILQQLDFQQHEVSRQLHDQVTPLVDRDGISADVLPSPDAKGMDEKASWTMESIIDAEGTAAVKDALRRGESDLEWDAAKNLQWIRRRMADGMSEEEAIQKLAALGGEDAAEGFRDIAGEEHVDRYLKKAGSAVWIGGEASRDLDDQVGRAIDDHDLLGDPAMLEKLKEAEEKRAAALHEEWLAALEGHQRRDGDGIPFTLVDEEYARTDDRLLRIERALDGFGDTAR